MTRVTPENTAQSYTVKQYDSIAAIARRLTGSTDYSAIYEQNKSIIGDNPNNLAVGMVLQIPGATASTDDDW